MTIRLRAIFLVTIAMLLLGADSARADDMARAKALFKQGQSLYSAAKFSEALKTFQAALKLAKRASILLNIAQTYRQLNNPKKAIFYYKYFLSRWRKESPSKAAPFAKEIKRYIVSLGKKVDALEKSEAELKRRESERRRAEAEKNRRAAELAARAAVAREARERKARRESEARRRYEATMHAAQLKAKEAEREAAARQQAALAAQIEKSRRNKTRWGWSALGVGIACAVGAGVMYGIGVSQGNAAYDKYKAARPDQPAADRSPGLTWQQELVNEWSKVDSAQTKVTVAHLLAAGAGVSVAIGIYALVTRPEQKESADEATRWMGAIALTPSATPNSASLSLIGRF